MGEVQRAGDQPLPIEGHADVFEGLIALLRERQKVGIERYGRSLQTFNGRSAERDALEELLDLFVYLRQGQMERAELERHVEKMAEERDMAREQLAEACTELAQARAALNRAEELNFRARENGFLGGVGVTTSAGPAPIGKGRPAPAPQPPLRTAVRGLLSTGEDA